MSTYTNPLVDDSPQMELSYESAPSVFPSEFREAILSDGIAKGPLQALLQDVFSMRRGRPLQSG